jgi:thiol-disulfide isomerase/thioredoxin
MVDAMILRFASCRARLVVVGALFLAACTSAQKPAPVAAHPEPVQAAPFAPPVPKAATEVLMINGGGKSTINYQSHLLHLEHMRRVVTQAGIPVDHISILASDGSDPGPDLATREKQPEADFWRLRGTRLEYRLKMPTTMISSTLEGATLEPATKESVTAWFTAAAGRLHAGDTLLLYVTDHGTRNGDNPLDNRIMLWGEDAFISVRELSDLIAKLDPGVKVVSLMSQCFSGGFAGLAAARVRDGEPAGNVCGYFSSTADRKAYGCFPENLGKDNVGHSFEFIRAIEQTGQFTKAHQAVLIGDATPDVPLRTSDTYLESLLEKDAKAKGKTLEARADELLKEAFRDSAKWQADAQLLDAIAQAYGNFSPRSFAELSDLATRLPKIDEQLTSVSQAWKMALGDANASNLERFVAKSAEWSQRLSDAALAQLDATKARQMTGELLPALASFTASDPDTATRIDALHVRGDAAKDASYRMQVRLAVVLRLRAVLLSIAGRAYLETTGTAAERAAFKGLSECENFSLPVAAPATQVVDATPSTYPALDEDIKLTQSALPGWMGINFKEPSEEQQKKYHLSLGASLVSIVHPKSPAKAAGLLPDDIVLGPPGHPFGSKNQIRAWTMLAEVGKPGKLEILRAGKHRQITIVPDPYPMQLPGQQGPLKLGAAAPKVELKAYKGPVLADVGKKHMLYFWATWCGPCKAALPELLAFEKERKVPVIAVTDEKQETLSGFFKKFSDPFPKAVGMDEKRRTFMSYGVSGTPTFVLVDEKGDVVWTQVGYKSDKGLDFPGWTWSGRKGAMASPAAHATPAEAAPSVPAPSVPAPNTAPAPAPSIAPTPAPTPTTKSP